MSKNIKVDNMYSGGLVSKKRSPSPKPRGRPKKSTSTSRSRSRKKATPKKKVKPRKKASSSRSRSKSKSRSSSPKKKPTKRKTSKSKSPTKKKPSATSAKPRGRPRKETALPPPAPKVKEIANLHASVISIPSRTERIISVDKVPIKVVHHRTEGAKMMYTVEPLSSEGVPPVAPIPVVLDTSTNTITTKDASVQVNSIRPKGKTMTITTEESTGNVKTTESGKLKYKIAITGLSAIIVALLLALSGQQSMQCPVVENAVVGFQPEPLHAMIPELNALGVQGPITFAGMQVLNVVENHMTNKLKDAALNAVEKSKEAFLFGSTVTSIEKQKVIDELRTVIYDIDKNLKESQFEVRELSKETGNLQGQLSDVSGQVLELQTVLKNANLSAGQLEALNVKLSNIVESQKNTIKDLQDVNKDITDTLAQTIKDRTTIQSKKLALEQTNEVDKNDLKVLQDRVHALEKVEVGLNNLLKENVKFHKGEIAILKGKLNKMTDAAKIVIKYETEALIKTHEDQIAGLESVYSAKVKAAYENGKTEVGKVLNERIDTLQKKLEFAQTNSENFMEWAAPKMRVVEKDGKFKVEYNLENLNSVAPIPALVLKDIVQKFEEELNQPVRNWFGQDIPQPKPVIDITVTQNVFYRKGWIPESVGWLFGSSKESTGPRYQMVLVGASAAATSSSSQQYYYMPINVDDLPVVPELKDKIKDLMGKAAIVSAKDITTSVTENNSVPSSTSSSIAEVPSSTTSSLQTSPTADGLIHGTSTDGEILDGKNLESTPTSSVEQVKAENESGEVVDTVVAKIVTPAKVLVEKRPANTCATTRFLHLEFTPSDISEPKVSITVPLEPTETEINRAGENTVTVRAGEDKDGNTRVETVTKERSSCGEIGMLGLKITPFCVDEYISKLQTLKNLRKRREEPPKDMKLTEFELQYVKHELDAPFNPEYLTQYFGMKERFKVREYFGDDTNDETLSNMVKFKRYFSKANFMKAMRPPKVRKKVGWLKIAGKVLNKVLLYNYGIDLPSDRYAEDPFTDADADYETNTDSDTNTMDTNTGESTYETEPEIEVKPSKDFADVDDVVKDKVEEPPIYFDDFMREKVPERELVYAGGRKRLGSRKYK